MKGSLTTHCPAAGDAPVDPLCTPVAAAATGPAISAINGVRPRMPAAAPTVGRTRPAAAPPFGPPRAHPRTVAALPYPPTLPPPPAARAENRAPAPARAPAQPPSSTAATAGRT